MSEDEIITVFCTSFSSVKMIPDFSLTLPANSNFCFYSCPLDPKLVIMFYGFDCCNIFDTGPLNSIVIASRSVSTPHCLTVVSLPTVHPTSFSLRSIQKPFILAVSLEYSADHITVIFKNQTFYDIPDPLKLHTKWQSPHLPCIETPLKPLLLGHHKPHTLAKRLSLYILSFVYIIFLWQKTASVETSLSRTLPWHWNPLTSLPIWAVLPGLSLALSHLCPRGWPE